jgi:hypothetical protein
VVVITSGLGTNIENLPFNEVFCVCVLETQCPKVLKEFFENSETGLRLSFVNFQASLFHETK